jgi:hypothetical protein
MTRLACLTLVLALAACGVDDRPKTIEYVTMNVLAPTCGAAQCHSTFSGNGADIFDTVSGARASLVRNGLLRFDGADRYDPAAPSSSDFIKWMTQDDGLNPAIGRMPYDAPMPEEDIRFLEAWIAAGATGAQCDPANEFVCNNNDIVKCQSDWSFGPSVFSCTGATEAGCLNGDCSCAKGFGNCDMTPGCETALNVDGNCGACGTTCVAPQTCTQNAASGLFKCQ